jgi:hypothetical protein
MIAQGWENFYVVAGTAAATLIGLMFVIISLGAGVAQSARTVGAATFVTPTVIHFGAVLFNSLTLLMPWPSAVPPAIIVGLSAGACIVYGGIVALKARRLDFVLMDWIDWHFYAVLPCIANACLIGGACFAVLRLPFAPYAIAGGTVLLLVAAIRNAWDVALWIARNQRVPPP